MDPAVGLVQAYLNVNGYFTVAEYPVLEASGRQSARTVTDLDILAFRFAHAGHQLMHAAGPRLLAEGVPDPALGAPPHCADMIVGEVKEGAARLNAALRNPAVLEVALVRFGCCPPDRVGHLVRALVESGSAMTPAGHAVRVVAFGGASDSARVRRCTTVSMRHVVAFLRAYLRAHWGVLRHAQVRDSGLSILALLEKWGATESGDFGPGEESNHGSMPV